MTIKVLANVIKYDLLIGQTVATALVPIQRTIHKMSIKDN